MIFQKIQRIIYTESGELQGQAPKACDSGSFIGEPGSGFPASNNDYMYSEGRACYIQTSNCKTYKGRWDAGARSCATGVEGGKTNGNVQVAFLANAQLATKGATNEAIPYIACKPQKTRGRYEGAA